tara:strand:- start:226 stop:525 length:300 start_codon:yes stop_codon:yes gene_type:complete
MNKKTYIHTGGQGGDFDFLHEVIERDKIIKLPTAPKDGRQRVILKIPSIGSSFAQDYEFFTGHCGVIHPGSEKDDLLCDLVEYVENEIKRLGYGFKVEN